MAQSALAGLDGLAAQISRATDAAAVHRALRTWAVDAMQPASFFLARYDDATGVRACVHAYSDGQEYDTAAFPKLPLNDSPGSRALATGRPVLTEDLPRAQAGSPRVDVGYERDPRHAQSSLVVPLVVAGRPWGTLEVQSYERGVFGPAQTQLLLLGGALAAHALVAFEQRDAAARPAALEAEIAARTRELADANETLRQHAVARHLVRIILRELAHRGRLGPAALRELGRGLAASMAGQDLGAVLAGYANSGLGELRLVATQPGFYTFEGRDLLERDAQRQQPSCYLALGFLEGAVEGATARPGLGSELRCQALGHEACRFVVKARGP